MNPEQSSAAFPLFLSSNLNLWISAGVIVFGLLIGSFLNVVIARLPLDLSVVRPPSHCPSCKKRIAWFDNLPVLSFILLRGRCRNCQSRISPRYPLVELLTALLFFASFKRFGLSLEWILRDVPVLAMMIAIVFIDLDHRIIPDELSLGTALWSLATVYWATDLTWAQAVVGGAAGFGIFYFFAWAYYRSTGRSGLGGGDIKYLGALGVFLGWQGMLSTLLVSSILGSVVGIGWALAERIRNRESQLNQLAIPYGPFLVLGAIHSYLLGEGFSWLQFLTQI